MKPLSGVATHWSPQSSFARHAHEGAAPHPAGSCRHVKVSGKPPTSESWRSQYCERQLSDGGGLPDTFTWRQLPAGCGAAPSCACLANELCGDQCVATPDNGFMVSCPGG